MLTATVTKMFPTENRVGIHLKLIDDSRPVDEQVVIDQNFSENYNVGQDIPNEVRDKIGKRIQKAVDRYKVLKARFDNPKYDTVRNQIAGNLTL